MNKFTTRVVFTLGVLVVVLAAILTGWQGKIQIDSIAGGITIDSRPPIAINQAK